jgi:flagellar biosynthetic protein FliR
MEAAYPMLAGFLLVLLRCGSLCTVAPLFGTKVVPARIRVGLSAAISLAVFTGIGMPPFLAWTDTGKLVGAVASETAIGLCGGLTARMAIEAAGAAGHIMSTSMGLNYGSSLDPIHGAESNAVSSLMSFLALGVAVAAGIHREAIAWLCRSLIETPPGAGVDLPHLFAGVVAESARSAALAVRMAFPVMAAVTFGNIAFGLLGRVAPQINLQSIGFGLAILAGGGALYFVAPGAAELAAQTARMAFAAH